MRYLKLFQKLGDISKSVDMVVLGGDIFDKLPNTEEIGLYFELISMFDVPTFIFDGNHEATKKGHTFLHHLSSASSKVNSNVHILEEPCEIHNIDFIPYTHLKTFDPNDFHNELLCTHVRGDIEPHVKAEIDLDKLSGWDTVLAGDLHSYTNSQRNILYPGSPLTISFHRSKVSTGVIVFDTDTMSHEWIELELPQLIRKTVEDPEDMVKTTYDHTIYELLGSVTELSGLKLDDSILDKKIIDKEYSSTLTLDNMTIEEELTKYLSEIQKLTQRDIDRVIKEYHDCT